jgi:hypothetical protein
MVFLGNFVQMPEGTDAGLGNLKNAQARKKLPL